MQVSNRPLPNGTMVWCERGWKIVRNNYFPTLLDFSQSGLDILFSPFCNVNLTYFSVFDIILVGIPSYEGYNAENGETYQNYEGPSIDQ